jgi:outer membrane protein assembly factor BamA
LKKAYIFSILTILFLASCSIQKFIPENERLYVGSELIIEADSTIQNLSDLREDLKTVIVPKPNSKYLGMHLGLYSYYQNQKEKRSFLNRFIFKKGGQKPVYQSDVNPLEVVEMLRNRLENHGFFYSSLSTDVIEKGRKAANIYKLKIPAPYRMSSYKIDSMVAPIYHEIKQLSATSPFEKEMRFDVSNLKFERQRLDSELKQKGYYNFNENFLIFEADTNQYKNKKFDLFLNLKANVPRKATIPYKIDRINVYPNYNLNDSIQVLETRFKNKSYHQDTILFKPKYLDEFIKLKEGELYSPKLSRITSRRLSGIGAYKYVNIQYREIDTIAKDSIGSLEANIYLSPLTKRAIRLELQAVTKSNNFAGPELAITTSNRNVFKGGETLSFSLNVGYENQIASGSNSGLSSLEFGLKSELIFPRVISPFSINEDFFEYSIPKTKMSLGTTYLKRSQLYTLISGSANFGYFWNANQYITYEFNPVTINYTRLSDITPAFQEILNNNSFLQRSFDQQFISGLMFSFTYNEMLNSKKTHQFYLQSTVDVAGNMISLFDKEKVIGEPKDFLGLAYAQYAKIDFDARYHFNFGKSNQQVLAARLFAGYGLAYGNSDVVPFVKQYFSGGPYSVRAFNIRALGPGTYNEANSSVQPVGSFFDKTGNMRLEANIEYRFPIYSFFKGAIFADAGNIWNTEANPIFDGKDTFSSNFINELGMGAGVGLRIDLQGFVIRFDLAAPFHDPSLIEQGKNWDFRIDEPVFNFAIGYSF